MEDKIKQFLKTIKLNESTLSMFFGIVTVILVGVLIFRIYNANKPEITEMAEDASSEIEKVGEVEVKVEEDGKKYPATLPDFYTVQAGDHLWSIAERHYGSGYNWVDIATANELKDPGQISEGQEIKLPKVAVIEVGTIDESESESATEEENEIKGENYKVVKGDHLWSIAVRAYGDGHKWVEIARANELANPNYIEVDQELRLPR